MMKITNKKTEKPPVPQKNIEQPTGKVMQLCTDIIYIKEKLEKNKYKINNIKEEFKKKLMEENIQI